MKIRVVSQHVLAIISPENIEKCFLQMTINLKLHKVKVLNLGNICKGDFFYMCGN